jgi:hypothetical protein
MITSHLNIFITQLKPIINNQSGHQDINAMASKHERKL